MSGPLDRRSGARQYETMKLESVCVYCGSSVGGNPAYAEAAERLGVILAEADVRLVYGGGSIGLMGIMARSVLNNGGEVLGIIPGFLKDREIAFVDGGEQIVTEDMHSRKRAMFDNSDAFVALPGGIGTLEETVEMMTWMQLGQHRMPIVLANLDGFWQPLIDLLAHMDEAGFMHRHPHGAALYQVVNDVEAILPALRQSLAGLPDEEATLGDTELL
jgi:uncharacterized protein (TIGR00730 family)